MKNTKVLILGAGPAGLGAAFQLTRQKLADVTVIERNAVVGGNAGSFPLASMNVDYGSHRLHPSSAPEILSDIRQMLGDDLLDRPRHGRIRLRGRWIHFPLKPIDLLCSLPPSFALGVGLDAAQKLVPRHSNGHAPESFATILERGLGRTICRDFYFPYAKKIWGLDADELSPIQARRRVRAGSLGKLVRKVLSAVPGLKPAGAGRFFYPRRGFGQISEAYHQAARQAGAEFLFRTSVTSIHAEDRRVQSVDVTSADRDAKLSADYVWSTIPITILTRCFRPSAPAEVLTAVDRIRYRSMILVYLVLQQQRFTEYDAHYFPDPSVAITRLHEHRNYSLVEQPRDRTVICAELPCDQGDEYWQMTDEQLREIVLESLSAAGVPVQVRVLDVVSRRLPQAYPIYDDGFEVHFDAIDKWLGGFHNLLSFGRQGLFAHDNTHHALAMAYAAVNCLSEDGRFDRQRWGRYRTEFEKHVVED